MEDTMLQGYHGRANTVPDLDSAVDQAVTRLHTGASAAGESTTREGTQMTMETHTLSSTRSVARRSHGVVVCAASALAWSIGGAALAAITVHHDRASWIGAAGAGPVTTIQTSTVPLGPWQNNELWLEQGLLMWESSFYTFGVTAGGQNPNGYNLAETWGVDPTTPVFKTWTDLSVFRFPEARTSFALEAASVGTHYMIAYYADGTMGQSFAAHWVDFAYGSNFVGFTTDKPFERIDMFWGDNIPGNNHRTYIRTFEFGAAVPAPGGAMAVLTGLLSGALGCGRSRERVRRSRAAPVTRPPARCVC
ncbi:MAG: hypothetical protein NTU45_11175 [Planctomycetota bacterium]|nr:hypothetical protein [Planctomycetota bacterium]